jgi:hypothetical protein
MKENRRKIFCKETPRDALQIAEASQGLILCTYEFRTMRSGLKLCRELLKQKPRRPNIIKIIEKFKDKYVAKACNRNWKAVKWRYCKTNWKEREKCWGSDVDGRIILNIGECRLDSLGPV